ncbi:MAG TPA: polysaccharide deacetylase family protein [Acidimicrobiales bacterium]|nr:polysaccharide deacetylase family protein [Acidimicrobiales bacterium]
MGDDSPSFHLTFDGAPHCPHTDALLDVLAAHGVTATFFLEGHRLEDQAECARRIVTAGHEIANHSYTHPMMDELDPEEVVGEVRRAQEVIHHETGVRTRQFRPPWGRLSDEAVRAVHATGHDVILWNVSIRDWEGPDAASVANRILRGLADGCIVALHDRVEWNPEVLELVIPRIEAAGYSFRPVSEARDGDAVLRRPTGGTVVS